MRIDMLIPTRARPSRLHAFLQSLQNHTAQIDKLCAAVYIDQDDTVTLDAMPRLGRTFPFAKLLVRPRIDNGGDRWNELWRETDGEIIGLGADDFIVQKTGWDDMVRAEFEACPDHILLVHGRDGINDPEKVTQGWVSRKSTDILGYYMPSHFKMLWVDTWLEEIYNGLGRRKLIPDILIRHMHFSQHPQLWDETYARTRGPGEHEKQHAIWVATLGERVRDTAKLRGVLNK